MRTYVSTLFVIALISATWNAVPTKAQGLTETDNLLLNILDAALPTTQLSALVTYNHMPTSSDLWALTTRGLLVNKYDNLPIVAVTGLPTSIRSTFSLSGVISVWSNRLLGLLGNTSRTQIGASEVASSLNITGRGVGVAVVDTGVDGLHPDLLYGSAVTQNLKIISTGINLTVTLALPTTDTTTGHGTYCAGIIAGRGTASSGEYTGIAPGSNIIGLGVGDAGVIISALAAFDWILGHRTQYNIKVVSNSWGTTGDYSPNDPVNVATKYLHDAGIAVVFSAGNNGPAASTINPYAVAPWVIGVGAANQDGATLASFSSRGTPGDATLHPTITAPGVFVVSCRTVLGLVGNLLGALYDLALCSNDNPLSYACNVGTSVAAPHVSGTLALMLEAKPSLTPDQLKSLIVQSATPMPNYQQYEVGAGFLNALAAVQLAQAQ